MQCVSVQKSLLLSYLVDVGYEQGEHVYVVRDQRLQLFHVRLHEAVHSFQQVLYSLFEKLTISAEKE